jgi:hypothetical protein
MPVEQQEEKAIPAGKPKVVLKFPAPVKNPAAVALGLLGGAKGGRKRAANLSQEERTAIARLAAKARWAKRKDSE